MSPEFSCTTAFQFVARISSDGLEDHRTWNSQKYGNIGLAPTA